MSLLIVSAFFVLQMHRLTYNFFYFQQIVLLLFIIVIWADITNLFGQTHFCNLRTIQFSQHFITFAFKSSYCFLFLFIILTTAYRSLHELQPQLRMSLSKANKELLVARDSPSRYLNLPYVSSMVSTVQSIGHECVSYYY